VEYKKLLYGDLVKFIVEFQNQNGRNIQYNNFLFEMGNWSAEPGFNPESNDQFSRIVNNNKKPVNAYYKYNDKIIRHLCSIVDKDISIFPIDTEKRNELMSVIVERFFKNGNSDNKYNKIEEYYSNKDFEKFMIAVFDFAHFNSVNYFNDKRKKESGLNEVSLDITGQDDLGQQDCSSDSLAEGEPERFTDNNINDPGVNDNEPGINNYSKFEKYFGALNIKKKNVLSMWYLILAILICVFLFINRIAYDPLAIPAPKGPKLDSAQLHVPVNDEVDSGINHPVNDKKEQGVEKNISENKGEGIAETNPGLSTTPKDRAASRDHYSTKKPTDKAVSQNQHNTVNPAGGSSASKDHQQTAKDRQGTVQKNSKSEEKDTEAGTNITINGNGVFVIGDKNVVNVH
jgi:hypothetical protein